MSPAEYWQESVEIALDEMGLYHLVEAMTKEQRAELGNALAGSHECYGMAFYSPPASDRQAVIDREWKAKLAEAEAELERYRGGVEVALRRAYKLHFDTPVSVDSNGRVYRHGGRTEQIA